LNTTFLPARIYKILFSLLGLIYIIGLFVPLMDNDSAHHANIALHMYLTGDYVSLVDYGRDYLDKPHLHFWLCAFSYKIFGVNTFAYKFPSFLFTLLGTWSTYRLGKSLYDSETGKLAALILGSAFAYILANNDVRMDAILTSCLVFSTWQLVDLIQNKQILNIAGAALGLALGFSTKGHIAVFIPAIAALSYLFYRKDWKSLLDWRWLLLIVLFAIFICPVVYCYYLQYNFHPEKIVRGKDHVNGVKFILFGQSIERFQGDSFGSDSKHDYFFFLHSFLWAFAPWSILAYISIAIRIKNFASRKDEWLTTVVFVAMLLVVSFSGFKLPHYLNIIFPSTAVLSAAFIIRKREDPKWIKSIFTIQLAISILLLVFIAALTFWAFPVKKLSVIIAVILLLSVFFYFLKSTMLNRLQKAVCFSAAAMILSFFLLNANFYPQLLKYQGGNELAFATRGTINPDEVYAWKETYSSSYNFYTKHLRQPFTDTTYHAGKRTWLLFDIRSEDEIRQAGYQLGKRFEAVDFEITRLDLKFVNPSTREARCTKLVLAEITNQQNKP
jgi:4-amino-4-deoxy-L-arabinose transferase-like glycosyltransferase